MTSLRTPLSRARGLGSAKQGVSHFIGERVGGLVLILLMPWALAAGVTLSRTDGLEAAAWLGSPVNAVLGVIFLAAAFHHLHSTMRVVVEDYVYGDLSKVALLLANFFVCVLGGALAVFCVLKVALTSGAF